jgi:ATP-binding cassette subfamily F protein 3
LYDYPGTILFVSHDRYFLNKIATRVLELSPDGVTNYLGNYDYYVEKKQELAELAAEQATANAQGKKAGSGQTAVLQPEKSSYELDKEAKRRERQRLRRLEEIEETIRLREEAILQWEEELCRPEVYTDHTQVKERNDLIQQAKAELEELYNEWSQLSEG